MAVYACKPDVDYGSRVVTTVGTDWAKVKAEADKLTNRPF